MLIPDNTGTWVPAGRMARTRTTDFWDGGLPEWLSVTDGTPAASTRPAGGLALTGSTIGLESASSIVLSDIPTTPDVEGTRQIRTDLHFTGGALDGELFAYGLTGPNGTCGVEKTSGGSGASLRMVARDAAGNVTRNDGTNTDIGASTTAAGNMEHKRYILVLIYDPYDRGLYLSEGDALQDVAHFTPEEFVHGTVVPYVRVWTADGTTSLTKDFHQFTVTSWWL